MESQVALRRWYWDLILNMLQYGNVLNTKCMLPFRN